MRIYDHLIRVFQLGSWESAGDLRSGNAGVFGCVQGVSPLFARAGAHRSISNCTPLQDTHDFTLSNFAVSLWFDPLTEETLSDVEMENLCIEGMKIFVVSSIPGEYSEFATEAREFAMATRFVCHTGRVVDVAGAHGVTVTDGSPFRVAVLCEGKLLEHLNGYVRRPTLVHEWVPGDPKMTRIVRVSCDLSWPGGVFLRREQPF